MKKRLLSGLLTVALALVSVLAAGETVQAAGNGLYTDKGSYTDGVPTQDDEAGSKIGINVRAKVAGVGDVVYSVKVDWGDMTFVYDYGSAWDPVSHKYISENGNKQDGGWDIRYVNGTNNKITVTNDSNYPVDAKFSYENTAAFNPSGDAATNVKGIFDLDNEHLKSQVQANPTSTSNSDEETLYLNTVTTNLQSGEKYYYQGNESDPNTGAVYFSLIGKPDRGIDLKTLQNVGSINVTIKPAETVMMKAVP